MDLVDCHSSPAAADLLLGEFQIADAFGSVRLPGPANRANGNPRGLD
jgi:hypothetical protein